MRLLPEAERIETLGILARNKQEVERALQVSRMRFVLSTTCLLKWQRMKAGEQSTCSTHF